MLSGVGFHARLDAQHPSDTGATLIGSSSS
jgi:hypothetical protein